MIVIVEGDGEAGHVAGCRWAEELSQGNDLTDFAKRLDLSPKEIAGYRSHDLMRRRALRPHAVVQEYQGATSRRGCAEHAAAQCGSTQGSESGGFGTGSKRGPNPHMPGTPRPVLGDLTVIIPTLGRPMLQGCLAALVAGDAWPGSVIVVDQGSDAAVDSWVSDARSVGMAVEHVRSSERGIAVATNWGIDRVRTPFFAVTHDDCRVAPDWAERMVASLRAHRSAAVVTGRVEPEGPESVPSTVTSTVPRVYTRPLLAQDVLFPANMGAPLDVARRIGRLDERPLLRNSAEDNDWQYRALRLGVPIAYEPEVVVRHLGWRDAHQRAATYRIYARGQAAFYQKYIRRADWFMISRLAFDLLRSPWWWLRGSLTGNRDLAAMGRAYTLGLPRGVVAAWSERDAQR